MNNCIRTLAGLALIASCLASENTVAASQPARNVDASIERALEIFEAPGMAVAVVHDGELAFAGGQGFLAAETSERVDEHTLFRIGSVSKAFTAATLAILADEGGLDWDDPVIDYLPEFRMHDAWVTREFTVRDLLTHRSGLPLGAGDLLIFPDGNATIDDIIRAFRFLEPTTSFRSTFAYDNLLYIVAGEVAARVAGMPFAELLEERLLQPLGMTDCVASADRAADPGRLATPHMLQDGDIEPTPSRITSVAAAAGGIACSARSMAIWMQFMLSEGETSTGERLLSKARFQQLVAPETLLPVPGYLAEHAGASLNAYALGWGVSTFYGQPIWSHGGGVWGMTTFIAILPDEQLAVFASNNLMSVAPRAIVYDVIEQVLSDAPGSSGTDWIAILAALAVERGDAAAAAVTAAWEARDTASRPSLPLGEYAGRFRDSWYGDILITVDGDGELWFRSERNPPLNGRLEHFQYDTFVARWNDRRLNADAYVSFNLNADGSIEAISMKAVSPATDFSFDFHHLDLRPVSEE